MTQHTPAPWATRFDGELWVIEANDGASCIATGAPWFGRQQPGEANARLIATAPDLLAFARMVAAGNTEIIELERLARNLVRKAGD